MNCRRCTESAVSVEAPGWILNEDLAMQFAACHRLGWTVFSGASETGGKTCVEIDSHNPEIDIINVHAYTLESALLNAMVEATIAIADRPRATPTEVGL